MSNIFKPISGQELPRFAGLPTFMRLPYISIEKPEIKDVDIGLIGIPWDAGTTNRPGPRHGPRQLRDFSTMIRACNAVTRFSPFENVNCADLGDVGPNPVDIHDTLERISRFYKKVKKQKIIPMSVGGDHLCSLPILRGISDSDDIGLLQFDSHTDLFYSYFGGSMYTHGTPFRRAIEEGLINPKKIIQIGIRGTAYDFEDRDFANSVGIRIITIEEFFKRDLSDIFSEVKSILGKTKTYLTYDIDFVDPAYAPGTGTPEVGGPNSFQSIEVIRSLDDINLIGADLVEVSPPFDNSGSTAWLGVSIIFEILCVLAKNIKLNHK